MQRSAPAGVGTSPVLLRARSALGSRRSRVWFQQPKLRSASGTGASAAPPLKQRAERLPRLPGEAIIQLHIECCRESDFPAPRRGGEGLGGGPACSPSPCGTGLCGLCGPTQSNGLKMAEEHLLTPQPCQIKAGGTSSSCPETMAAPTCNFQQKPP